MRPAGQRVAIRNRNRRRDELPCSRARDAAAACCHLPAYGRSGHHPGSSARPALAGELCSVRRQIRTSASPGAQRSLQRIPAALRYPELASLRTVPLRRFRPPGAHRCESDSPSSTGRSSLRFFAWRNGLDNRVGEFTATIVAGPFAARRQRHSPAHCFVRSGVPVVAGGFAPPGRPGSPSAGRQRSWDSCPSQLCAGRTVPRASSAPEAHLSFVRHIHLGEFMPRYRP